MAVFPGGCEFPLLRERFWKLAAAGMPSGGSPGPASPERLSFSPARGIPTSSPSPVLPPHSSPMHRNLRTPGTASVDIGSLQSQEVGSQAAHEDLSRSDSAAEPAIRGRMGLRTLDLQALPRDDAGPPSELGARRQKFAQFEGHCSEVAPGLCVGGESVARNRETLRAAGVTHVVNCVGMLVPNCFPDELTYLTLYLEDTPGQDLISVLYTVFDFVEEARQGGGCVLVHCSQGVSRSAALVMAFLMWKLGQPYDEVYQAVKAIRGVANPNIGFTCQLLQWQKRRLSAPSSVRVLRMAPAATAAPTLLVPKIVSAAGPEALDPRGVFLIVLPQVTFIWQGSRAAPDMWEAASAAADALERYEGTAPVTATVVEGTEPPEVAAALQLPENFTAQECRTYDADFEVIAEASAAASSPAKSPASVKAASAPATAVVSRPTPRSAAATGLKLAAGRAAADSSRSLEGASPRGSKTPRAATADSPNFRRRKSARADLQQPVSPGRPAGEVLETSSDDSDDDDGIGSDSDASTGDVS